MVETNKVKKLQGNFVKNLYWNWQEMKGLVKQELAGVQNEALKSHSFERGGGL